MKVRRSKGPRELTVQTLNVTNEKEVKCGENVVCL